MRMLKLAVAATTLFAFGITSASAITAQKRREAPGTPAEIWEIVGDFCAIKSWHPAIAECVETKEGDVVFRTLTLKDGAKIKEKLTGTDGTSYSYEIVESPLPLVDYKATISVADVGGKAVVVWASTFEGTADGAADIIAGIYQAGLDALAAKFGA